MHPKVSISFSLAIGPDCSIYNVVVVGSPVLHTTSLLPSQPKPVPICGVIKQNQSLSQSNSVFIFPTNCMHHVHIYILQNISLKLVIRFQRYEQLKDAKNNRKQDIFCFVWLYLKINISDFRLILLDHITFIHLS